MQMRPLENPIVIYATINGFASRSIGEYRGRGFESQEGCCLNITSTRVVTIVSEQGLGFFPERRGT